MRLGLVIGEQGGVDGMVRQTKEAADAGFSTVWTAQIFGVDALTAMAVIGREVPDIELGTAVIPTYPRHPMMLAAQALTVQQITGSGLALGIGLSRQFVIEAMFGMSFAKPVGHMKDYLAILGP